MYGTRVSDEPDATWQTLPGDLHQPIMLVDYACRSTFTTGKANHVVSMEWHGVASKSRGKHNQRLLMRLLAHW